MVDGTEVVVSHPVQVRLVIVTSTSRVLKFVAEVAEIVKGHTCYKSHCHLCIFVKNSSQFVEFITNTSTGIYRPIIFICTSAIDSVS